MYSILPEATEDRTDCSHGFTDGFPRVYPIEFYEHTAAVLRSNGKESHAADIEFFCKWIRHLSKSLGVRTKTSEEWHKEVKDFCRIMDPDGWDRSNYQHSWHEEKISKQEFCKRVGFSTCQCDFNKLTEWAKRP